MVGLTDVAALLQAQFPLIKIFAGAVDRDLDQCLGVFTRQPSKTTVAIGGIENSSYRELNIAILVHWTEDTALCEAMAESVCSFLHCKKNFLIGSKKVNFVVVDGEGPIDISRDNRNIAEMVIHATINYER